MSDRLEHWRREDKKYRFPSLLLLPCSIRPTGIVEIGLFGLATSFHRKLLKKQIRVFRYL